MKNYSIWKKNINNDKTQKLDENLTVDVLIIGGGMTGVSTAYNLMNQNLKVALVERNKVGSGITSKSTAKITFLQQDIYTKLEDYYSEKKSKLYLESQIEAIKTITSIIKENNIECNLEKSDSYIFSNTNKGSVSITEEQKLLNKFGIKTTHVNSLPNKEKCKYGISVNNTYVFNPIKYLNDLKNICENNKINIYEDTKIISIKKDNNIYICSTKTNIIKAKYVVLALHYPYFLFPFLIPIKTTLEKSYIESSPTKNNMEFNAINIEKPTKSIRYYNEGGKSYKIFLTGSHNICVKNNEKNNFDKLNKITKNKNGYQWSNIDIITNDYLPFIGKIDDNLLIGTGYNTWGMTNSTIAGKILSDIVLKKDNKYIELFNPKRNINISKILKLPISLSSNIYSFLNTKINLKKSWYNNNIRFEKKDNNRIAIYTDSNNKEHIVYNLCPHLKCNLIFNEVELTWDCPCHGSRFDIDGNCIEGPSNYDITYKKKP